MGVSKNRGTSKSSILNKVSFVNHPFWGTPIFRKHPYTPPKTNSSPFKNGAWETTFLLRRPVFQERPVRLLVSGRV